MLSFSLASLTAYGAFPPKGTPHPLSSNKSPAKAAPPRTLPSPNIKQCDRRRRRRLFVNVSLKAFSSSPPSDTPRDTPAETRNRHEIDGFNEQSELGERSTLSTPVYPHLAYSGCAVGEPSDRISNAAAVRRGTFNIDPVCISLDFFLSQ